MQMQRSSIRDTASSPILAAFFHAGGEKVYNFIWNFEKQSVLTGLFFTLLPESRHEAGNDSVTGISE
jgi:hypothetical protein